MCHEPVFRTRKPWMYTQRWAVRARHVLFSLLLLVNAPSTAHGQQLIAGDMIRVRASQSTGAGRGWTEGSVVRLTADTLWYQSGGSVSAMSLDNVELERSTFRNHGLSGLGIGAVAGGAIGALVANVISEQTYRRRGCHSDFTDHWCQRCH